MCGPPTTRTILLVDHESALMKLMKALLDGAGFRVLAATGAREALEICRQTKVDLLLTDVNLHDLTGPELAMHVANFAPDVRVLYMSGSDAKSLGAMGLSSMDPALLRKPFSPAALLNAVDGALDLFPPGAAPPELKSHPRTCAYPDPRHPFPAAKQTTIEPGWPKPGSAMER
jgi:CheY-like chemotaxis protein